jgi:uncharacterized protein
MLAIRPCCENCGKLLPNDSTEAMICTYECTFCKDCVTTLLFNVCPNCGGGFEKRPTRPAKQLEKNPASYKTYISPIDIEKFKLLLNEYQTIDPHKR